MTEWSLGKKENERNQGKRNDVAGETEEPRKG